MVYPRVIDVPKPSTPKAMDIHKVAWHEDPLEIWNVPLGVHVPQAENLGPRT